MRDLFRCEDAVKRLLAALAVADPEQRLFDGTVSVALQGVAELAPQYYFPDLYLETSLQGRGEDCVYVVYDHFDYNRVNMLTKGEFWRDQPLPDLTEEANSAYLTGYCLRGQEKKPFHCRPEVAVRGSLQQAEEVRQLVARAGGGAVPRAVAEQVLRLVRRQYRVQVAAGSQGYSIFLQPPLKIIRDSLVPAAAGELLELWAEEFSFARDLAPLKRLLKNYALPVFHQGEAWYERLLVCAGYLRLEGNEQGLTGIRLGVRATTKNCNESGFALKNYVGFQWHITDLCDQRCRHCYLFGQDPALVCHSTPYEELEQILDRLEEYGAKVGSSTLCPTLVGGDPLLHPEFWRFARELYRRGYPFIILGNPFHLTPEVCQRLHSLGCIKYQLSLDGREDFHDRLRKPGSYRATLQAARYLEEAGIIGQFMATVSRLNMEEVLDSMEDAVAVGISRFRFARFCSTDGTTRDYPSPREYRDFLLRYHEKAKRYRELGVKTDFTYKEHLFALLRWELGELTIPDFARNNPEVICDGCHLGQSICILPNGDAMACRRMDSVVGNVLETGIWELISSEACQAYRDISAIEKCRDCELGNLCRGCRAVNYNVTGNLQGADPMCWKE